MFVTKCVFCNKEIQGYSLEQAEYMMMQHKLSVHKDKISIKDPDTNKWITYENYLKKIKGG